MTKAQYAKKFTPEEREAYKQAQRDEAQRTLEAAVESLQTDEGFRSWLKARALFHTYSLNNTLLIIMQMPEATRIASARVWKQLGRWPAKGSKSLKVFVPWTWYVKALEGEKGARWNADKKRWEKKVMTFKLGPVFDVSQTDGEELPEPTMPAELDGDSHAHLEEPLLALCTEKGFTVDTEKLTDGSGGYCDPTNKRIVLGAHLSPNARVRVLTHELAHALGIGYVEFGRDNAEVIVEAVTYIVLAGQGFDLDTSSVPYIAIWGNGHATEKMRGFVEKIDELARWIEQGLAVYGAE